MVQTRNGDYVTGAFPPPRPEVVKGVSEKPKVGILQVETSQCFCGSYTFQQRHLLVFEFCKVASAAPIRAAGYVPPHVRSSGGRCICP